MALKDKKAAILKKAIAKEAKLEGESVAHEAEEKKNMTPKEEEEEDKEKHGLDIKTMKKVKKEDEDEEKEDDEDEDGEGGCAPGKKYPRLKKAIKR